QALRQAHPWLGKVMGELTALGSTVVLTLVTAVAAGYLWLLSERRRALLMVASVGIGTTLIGVLKNHFERLRPSAEFAQMVVQGLSFPSGHAAAAAIVFLTIAALLADTRARVAERAYVLGVALLVVLLVGISRVVLGVHWATDVLGGWAMGAGWALMGLLVSRVLIGKRDRVAALVGGD
ncbi:MAG: phosphatase PAP2 family protein, partial [Rubrivivax sp.]